MENNKEIRIGKVKINKIQKLGFLLRKYLQVKGMKILLTIELHCSQMTPHLVIEEGRLDY